MRFPEPSSLEFTVYQSVPPSADEGQPVRMTRHCGSFASIDAALLLARHLALQEVQWLEEVWEPGGNAGTVELIDTEWGYDVRADGRLTVRCWVHDAAAGTLQPSAGP